MGKFACSTSDPTSEETLDRSVIGQFRQADTAGLPDFALALIDQFVEEAESQIVLLIDAGQRGDARALKTVAHCLRGSSMTMGAKRLGALCARMETHADEVAAGGTSDLIQELDREFVRVRTALAAERQGAFQQ